VTIPQLLTKASPRPTTRWLSATRAGG
jgi:hypothetical protein